MLNWHVWQFGSHNLRGMSSSASKRVGIDQVTTSSLSFAVEPFAVVHHQTDFTAGSGNALQACIATLFGRPLETVPNFVALACGYEKGIEEFVAPHFDVRKIVFNDVHGDHNRPSVPPNTLVLLRGKSPRGTHGHVVLVKSLCNSPDMNFSNVHDPHPDGTFLDPSEAPAWCMVFIPRSPIPFFFGLPRSWFIVFLSEWLENRDVCLLDTAMMMHQHRPEFLQCLRDMRSTSIDLPYKYKGGQGRHYLERKTCRLRWMSRRKMHLECCYLHNDVSDDICQELFFPALRELHLEGVGERGAIMVISRCPTFRFIGIKYFTITYTLLHHIAQHCPLLETIDLTFSQSTADDTHTVTGSNFVSFLRQASHLKTVNMVVDFPPIFMDNDWKLLCDYGHLFVHLEINLTSMRFSTFIVHGISRFLASCSRLTTLRVVGAEDDTFFQVARFCRSCPLTTLCMDKCYLGSLPSTAGAQYFVGLTRLEMTDCDFPPSFYAAFGRLINLERLEIQGCAGMCDACVVELAKGGVKLKELTIDSYMSRSVKVTGAGFQSFIGTPISQSLEQLAFSGSPEDVESYVDIATALASCPRLTILNMSRYGDQEIAIMCEGRPLQPLSSVCLRHVPGLTIKGLMHLAATYKATLKCVQLREGHLSVAEVTSLRSNYPHIVFVGVLQSPLVTVRYP